MKTGWKITIALVSTAVLTVVGIGIYNKYFKEKSEEDEAGEGTLLDEIGNTITTLTGGGGLQTCTGAKGDPKRNYSNEAIMQMQNWLLKYGNVHTRKRVVDSGGADGYCGQGFSSAVAFAKSEGIITGMDNLRFLASKGLAPSSTAGRGTGAGANTVDEYINTTDYESLVGKCAYPAGTWTQMRSSPESSFWNKRGKLETGGTYPFGKILATVNSTDNEDLNKWHQIKPYLVDDRGRTSPEQAGTYYVRADVVKIKQC